jgi:ribonuclease J
VDRIQQVINVAARYGRKVAVTGRSMENILRVSTELGYMEIPPNTLVEMAQTKSLPMDKVVIITTGSQGETMSALYRMAFSTHKQVDIVPGDRIIISASAIPGNEKMVSHVVNELYRKDAEVFNERLADLHVSGHACQEELKIMHALTKPKYFIPVHGRVIELSEKGVQLSGTVPSGRVLVDGYGVGDVGSVVLRDRKHLAQDGMIVVVINLSSEDGSLVSGPDIITRGFVYVKESEELLTELRSVVLTALENCSDNHITDWATIKSSVKNELSGYLYKKTKRNPMILPVIMEI